MKQIPLILLALVTAAGSVQAQQPGAARRGPGAIHGVVQAQEGGQPLQAAGVTVRAAGDSAVVAAELTQEGGGFIVRGLAPGRYLVEASALGWATAEPIPAEVTAEKPLADLGVILLARQAIALEGVQVHGIRSAMSIQADRNIYDASKLGAAGGQAVDILRGVPELDVDIEGSVTLRGTSPQIFLNGRPAPMQGEALNLFLRQLPADRVERIEVMAVPSARFEAEGSGGIVNIVLKENVSLGLSGSVFLNGGTSGDLGGGGRLAWQEGPLTLFGGGFVGRHEMQRTSYDFRENLLVSTPIPFLEQDGWSERIFQPYSADLTAELKVAQGATVWSEVSVRQFGGDTDGVLTTSYLDATRDATARYDRVTSGESTRGGLTVAGGFRKAFDQGETNRGPRAGGPGSGGPRMIFGHGRRGGMGGGGGGATGNHELTAELRLQRNDNDDLERVLLEPLLVQPGAPSLPAELTVRNADDGDRELSLQLDYVRPLGAASRLEVGYRGEIEEDESDRLLEQFASGSAATPLVSARNGFLHREVFNALYATGSRQLGKWNVQLGMRAEHTDMSLDLPGGDEFGQDYLNFFPSANLAYDLGEGRQVRLSYSRRIRRPSAWVLNPIDDSTDPLNRQVGNPGIDPQLTHSVSLETVLTGDYGTLQVAPYFRRTEGDWARIKTVDAAGVSTVMWQNLASVDAYGTTVTASIRPIGGWTGFVSASGYREVRDASNLAFDYSGDSMLWDARLNLNGRLTDRMTAQVMGFYMPAREVPQGRFSSRVMTNFSLRQQLFGDRGSLTLAVMDPFELMKWEFETADQTHVQFGSSEFNSRRATLSFSWAFGKPPESARRRTGQDGDQPQQEEPAIR